VPCPCFGLGGFFGRGGSFVGGVVENIKGFFLSPLYSLSSLFAHPYARRRTFRTTGKLPGACSFQNLLRCFIYEMAYFVRHPFRVYDHSVMCLSSFPPYLLFDYAL